MIGWVKVHRRMREKGWYRDSSKVHLWIELLLRASHKKKEYMFNGQKITLEPGQFITGRKALSESTGIHESSIERMLTFFEKTEQQIEQQKTSHGRLISIVSWWEYQVLEQVNEQQMNN